MTSASEHAYTLIRDMIVRGDLRPGDALVAEELALACGSSRTPVREAILRLQAEMFAIRLDNKRTVVHHWSSEEIEEFVELRVRIAGYTAVVVSRRITDPEIIKLKSLNADLERIIKRKFDLQSFTANTTEFHRLILAYAGSERLVRLSMQLVNPGPLLRMFERHDETSAQDTLRNHQALTAGFEARDSDWAEAAMTVLVRRTYQPMVLMMTGRANKIAAAPSTVPFSNAE